MDISAILAELAASPKEELGDDLRSALSDMLAFGALPEIEDDEKTLAVDDATRQRRYYKKEKARVIDEICVLDFETDPFDNARPDDLVYPFLCVLYANDFDPIVIWDDDHEMLIEKVINQIRSLPGRRTIYAHNGGRFDYKYLIAHLKGEIKFKGSSIMQAMIGEHQLRDSLHILPTNLASLQKDRFDYSKMHHNSRHMYRDEIIQYCINDCKYALDFIQYFVKNHGFKISIGQAAFAEVNRLYPTIERLGKAQDAIFRQFFFGGRVECFEGNIHHKGHLKYIDLNSAYPAVMAHMKHPIGKTWIEDTEITKDTYFIELECRSRGAFIIREKIDGDIKTSAPWGVRHFYTTIHEYKAAMDLDLISDVRIIKTHNCPHATTFAQFVVPKYDERRAITSMMKDMEKDSDEWSLANKNQTVLKFLLNNAYGKFAQNPERYKEHFISEIGVEPEPEENKPDWQLETIAENYWLWARPNSDYRYNNVATGASITGAQRAVLLRALHAVERPLYCDTDSIICVSTGELEMHDTKLGAWKIENELEELIVNGKKLYAYQYWNKKKQEYEWTVRSKGASGLTLEHMIAINRGQQIQISQKGITLRNDGTQYYNKRTVRRTGLSERIREDGASIRPSNSDLVTAFPETTWADGIASHIPHVDQHEISSANSGH